MRNFILDQLVHDMHYRFLIEQDIATQYWKPIGDWRRITAFLFQTLQPNFLKSAALL